ncbi:hypothetical protein ZWY2020_033805 [Hordeum vulgare]|nr:hypothetical protein ZWY2020_033805 [Hordeum vulgare]
MGTTMLSFIFDKGVIVAADSWASMGRVMDGDSVFARSGQIVNERCRNSRISRISFPLARLAACLLSPAAARPSPPLAGRRSPLAPRHVVPPRRPQPPSSLQVLSAAGRLRAAAGLIRPCCASLNAGRLQGSSPQLHQSHRLPQPPVEQISKRLAATEAGPESRVRAALDDIGYGRRMVLSVGTMIVGFDGTRGCKAQGSRFSSSLYIYCMLMVSWMRVTNSTCQLRLLSEHGGLLSHNSVTELVVAVFVVVTCLLLSTHLKNYSVVSVGQVKEPIKERDGSMCAS